MTGPVSLTSCSQGSPFLGGKMELLEGCIRALQIARRPAQIATGTQSEFSTIDMDWSATLLEAAGTEPHPDDPLAGVSLMPLFEDLSWQPASDLHWCIKHRQQATTWAGIMRGNPDDADGHLLRNDSDMPHPTH